MSINQLLAQHQIAHLNVLNAASLEDHTAFSDLETYYARRISEWRQAIDLPATGWPGDGALAIR